MRLLCRTIWYPEATAFNPPTKREIAILMMQLTVDETTVRGGVPAPITVDDRSTSLSRANLIGFLALPIIALLALGPFTLLHGTDALFAGWRATTEPFWFFLIWIAASVVVHEGLHGLGFLLGGVSRSDIHFGFQIKTVTPFASCSAPMRVASYRVSAGLPAVALGLVPLIAGWMSGSGFMVVYAFWMLATAAGDFLILWLSRDLAPATLVIDHPSRAGCQVVSHNRADEA